MLDKVTFDEHVNALERYWIYLHIYKTLMALFPRLPARNKQKQCMLGNGWEFPPLKHG